MHSWRSLSVLVSVAGIYAALAALGHWLEQHYSSSGTSSLTWVATLGALFAMSIAQQLRSARAAQNRAEKAVAAQNELLIQRERLWKTLMECAPVGIYHSDAQGQLVYSNPKWREIIGMTPEMETQDDRVATLHEEDRERVLSKWRQWEETGGQFVSEHRLRRRDKSIVWLETHASRIVDERGKSQGYIGVGLEITARKEQAQQLEAERLRTIHASRMASLGEMAANIAHEINNPLAVINAIIFEMGYMEELSEDSKSRLARIEATTMRIASIVRGLRSFSRDSEQDPFDDHPLPTLLADVIELCRERFRIHNVTLDVGDVPNCLVKSRGVQLSQVFLNLLSNAFDAVQGQADARVSILVEKKDQRVLIRVSDSGPGIPPAVAERMMEPFFTTKEIGKGTGLGLSIARGLTQDHGGQLSYDPAWPTTSFVIDLPCVAPH